VPVSLIKIKAGPNGLTVRQWVQSVPKRLRYFMQRDGAVLGMVLRVIARSLSAQCPSAARLDKAGLHIGAVAFIHRFGSSLNEHVHLQVCVVDGVFDVVAGDVDAAVQRSAPGVTFHPASQIDETVVARAQATLRRRILRAFAGSLRSFASKASAPIERLPAALGILSNVWRITANRLGGRGGYPAL